MDRDISQLEQIIISFCISFLLVCATLLLLNNRIARIEERLGPTLEEQMEAEGLVENPYLQTPVEMPIIEMPFHSRPYVKPEEIEEFEYVVKTYDRRMAKDKILLVGEKIPEEVISATRIIEYSTIVESSSIKDLEEVSYSGSNFRINFLKKDSRIEIFDDGIWREIDEDDLDRLSEFVLDNNTIRIYLDLGRE